MMDKSERKPKPFTGPHPDPLWDELEELRLGRDRAVLMLERIELQLSTRTDVVIRKLMDETRETLKKVKP